MVRLRLHNESRTYERHSSRRRPLACCRWRHVVPVGVLVVQQSCGPGQTQLCQYWARPSWGMAISHQCFLNTLTSGCLTSSSNCPPHDSIILPFLSRSHHGCAAFLFEAFKKTGATHRAWNTSLDTLAAAGWCIFLRGSYLQRGYLDHFNTALW